MVFFSSTTKNWGRLILSLIFMAMSFAFPTDLKTQWGIASFFGLCALLSVIQLVIQARRRRQLESHKTN